MLRARRGSGQWRSAASTPETPPGIPGLGRRTSAIAARRAVAAVGPSMPSIRTRLVRDDAPLTSETAAVLDPERPGQQRAGGVVRPAVGRRRGDPELQRGAVAPHDRRPPGPRLDVHIDDHVAVARLKEIGDIGHRRLSYGPCPSDPSMPSSTSSSSRTVCSRAGASDDVFAESLRRREGAAGVGLLRGPPDRERPARASTTSGPASSRTSIPRFHTMRGKYVPRKAGWDCHGLPVEVEVEKELGLRGQARDRGLRHRGVQPAVPRVGAALRRGLVRADRSHRHVARHVRRVLDDEQRVHRERLVAVPPDVGRASSSTRATRSCPYCGRCGTALSSHELGQPGAYRDVTEDSVYVRFPVVDARLRPARVDDHAVDARLQRRRGGRPRHRVRAGARPRARRPRPRHGTRPGRGGARRGRGDRRAGAGRATSSACTTSGRSTGCPAERRRLARRRGRLRDHRRRLRHRAPRARVRRDRPRGRARPRASRSSTRSTPRPASTDAVPGLVGLVREGRRPGPHRGAARVGPARAGRAVPALVPALLALRHARSSTGPSPPGSRAPRATRPRCCARTRRSAGTPSTSSTAASATGSRTTSTGRSPATGSGARRSRSGAAATAAHDTCVGFGRRALRARRPRPHGPGPAPARTSTTSSSTCPECEGGRAWRVEPVLDAWFDSGSMPTASMHYPFENAGPASSAASPPTSSARRSTRPAAGSTRCSR